MFQAGWDGDIINTCNPRKVVQRTPVVCAGIRAAGLTWDCRQALIEAHSGLDLEAHPCHNPQPLTLANQHEKRRNSSETAAVPHGRSGASGNGNHAEHNAKHRYSLSRYVAAVLAPRIQLVEVVVVRKALPSHGIG